ncbi:MAG: purine-nucleoside phosphorylase [Candidatus Cloacimonetes bacterium]|nr:purine-nucleoside phosphorylase [Candidatus Cloacimonadota bacterium]
MTPQQYNSTLEYLKSKIPFQPYCAIILGTGLGNLANEVKGIEYLHSSNSIENQEPISSRGIESKIEIPYNEIPGFVSSTAPNHSGVLIAGYLSNTPVIVFKGRFHYYEGYTMEQVVYPVRMARMLGAKYLFVTNASGSINISMKPGQLVNIIDHINLMGTNPLIGKNQLAEPVLIEGRMVKEFGTRFPSMHNPYDKRLCSLAMSIAKDNNFYLKRGIYCAVSGPSMETKAECLMMKNLGADIVGMSTVPEVIAAVHCGLKVFGVSVVTNLSNIFHSNPHTTDEILKNAERAYSYLSLLIKEMLEKIK